MIQASPQMADRLRRIKLRPVATSPANAIIIDKLQKRISAGGPGSGPHPGASKQDITTKINALPNSTDCKPIGFMKETPLKVNKWSDHPASFRDEYKNVIDSIRNQDSKGYFSGVETIDPASLHTNQSQVETDQLHKVNDGSAIREPLLVVRTSKGDFVSDGNHRAVIGLLRNEKVQAKVYSSPESKTHVQADGSINWTSPSGPIGPDWYDAYIGTSPIPNDHPPSLKNPKLTKIPTAQDGWKKGDSKKAKDQAMDDLVEIHKRLRRQIGKPEVSFPALNPVYPTGVTGSAKGRK